MPHFPKLPVDAADVPLQRLVLSRGPCACSAAPIVCLRRVDAVSILSAMREHGVDHYCAAPIVHTLLITAAPELREGITQRVRGMVAGAAPPAAMIEGMAKLGFDITHVYGLTEVYGRRQWPSSARAGPGQTLSEQTPPERPPGVRYVPAGGHDGAGPPDARPKRPPTARPMGEIMFRGNIVMKGLT
jgi:fatty-acyl-CoA synthase